MESHETISLGDVLRTSKGKISDPYTSDYKFGVRGEDFDSNSLRLKRRTPIAEVGPTFVKTFKPGDILYVTRRAYLRKTAVPDFEGVCANTTLVLEHTSDKVAKALLPFIFQSEAFVQYAIDHSVGSTNPYTKWTDLKKFRFPLFSLDKQQELVQLFQGLETAIQATEAAIAKAETLKQSLMKELLTRGIGHTRFKQTELGETPESWEVCKLEDVCEIKHGFAFKGEFISDNATDAILMTPGNFNIGGGFKLDKYKFYTGDIENKSYIFDSGDLAVTMTDLSKDGDTLGYPALIPDMPNKIILHNQRIGKINVIDKESISSLFLYYLLCSDSYRKHVLSTASGSTVRHTSPKKILSYEFYIPDRKEQKQIVHLLSQSEENITVLQKKLRDAYCLKSQICNMQFN